MKIKSKTILSLLSLPLVSTIVAPLVGCSNLTPEETEIEKCNYTVKGFEETSTESNKATTIFYIGPGIKGYVQGKWFINNFTEDFTCEITSNDGFVGANIYIPKNIDVNGSIYTVVGVGGSSLGSIQAKVVLPESTKQIEDNAFSNCNKLTNAILPNGLITIGKWAFSGCSSLTSITLPNSLTTIEPQTFYACSSLTSITLPNSITTIEPQTFYACSSLTSITLPNSLTTISGSNNQYMDSGTFSYCTSLTSITLPNSLTTIEKWTFSGCSSLQSIIFLDFDSQPSDSSNWSTECFSYTSSTYGTVISKNGNWSSTSALQFAIDHGLSNTWHT